jgi:hypothetical protein
LPPSDPRRNEIDGGLFSRIAAVIRTAADAVDEPSASVPARTTLPRTPLHVGMVARHPLSRRATVTPRPVRPTQGASAT